MNSFLIAAMVLAVVFAGGAIGLQLQRVLPEGYTTGGAARSVLRHIRVASPEELRDRILHAIDRINRRPVVHTWKWGIREAG
jgi:hypothetical protein